MTAARKHMTFASAVWGAIPVRPALSCLRTAGAAACAAAVLSGCLTAPVGPDYKRPPVPLPDAWRIDVKEAADVTNTDWWKSFGDPDLDDLIAAALAANSDLLIATARMEQFNGKLEVSESHRFPQVGAEAGFERNFKSQEIPEELRPGQPTTYNVLKLGPDINFEFDFWGKVRRANEAARADLLSSEEARHTVMLTVVTTVASNYIQLLELDRELELARQMLESLKKSLALTDEKYRGGSATLLSVAMVRAEVENEAAVIPQLERNVASSENNLSKLIGRSPGPIKRGRIDQLVLAPVPSGVPSDVLTRRPDILAAEQNLVAANARIGVAKSQYFPSLPLTGFYGVSSDLSQYLFAVTAHSGFYDIDALLPVLSWGRISGQVREARAETKENVFRYLQSVLVALQEINDALTFNVDSKERAAALDRRVAALLQVDQLMQARFEGGQSTYLDVLDSDREVYTAESEQTQSIGDVYMSLISVYKAMGGGWMVEQDKQDKQRSAKTDAKAAAMSVPASVQVPATIQAETVR